MAANTVSEDAPLKSFSSACRCIGDSAIVSPMGTDLARVGMAPGCISVQLDAAATDLARTCLASLADHSSLA